jgi:hypothetical protein
MVRTATRAPQGHGESSRWIAVTTLALLASLTASAHAGTLATGQLLVPLAPDSESRLRIALPPALAADQPVWVVYDMVALAPDARGEGEISLEGSLEGAITPALDMLVTFHADDMTSNVSAGTVPERLEQIAGRREPAELRAIMGPEMYAAYEALNAGAGRILTDRIVRHLPAPGRNEGLLLVSVERAQGIQPLALQVTAGQGELPASLRPATGGTWAFTLGRIAGGLLFLWLLYWLFVGRRKSRDS